MRGLVQELVALSSELRATDDYLLARHVDQHDAALGPILALRLLLRRLSGDNFSPLNCY